MQVKLEGRPITLTGDNEPLKVGDDAPKVWLKPKEMGSYQVGGKKDKVQIISVMPSIDTSICQLQSKRFSKIYTEIPEVEIIIVSMDLPFAQHRFCSFEGIKNLSVVSDFKNREFGRKYGLLIDTPPLDGLLTRAVLVVDKNGKIIYQEICEEIQKEPNYDAVLNTIKMLRIRAF